MQATVLLSRDYHGCVEPTISRNCSQLGRAMNHGIAANPTENI